MRRIQRLANSRTKRPRFKTPGCPLALLLFLLAALLSLWGNGSGEAPPAPSRPMPAPSAPPASTPVEPPPVFVPEEPEEPEEVDGCPEGCEERLPGCDIKGNTSYRTGERIYHLPGQQFYDRTIIDPGQGERWFCNEEEAVANGWRKSKR